MTRFSKSFTERPNKAQRVPSSIQFRIPHFDKHQCRAFCEAALQRGVEIKWFGNDTPVGYTSTHKHWRYLSGSNLAQTDRILATLFDLRLPLTLTESDFRDLVDIIVDVARLLVAENAS